MTFWLGVGSADHAYAGRDAGFAQLGHGRHDALASLRKGDWIIYYSPRQGLGSGDLIQAFTTIGRVRSEEPYRVTQAMNLNPYRVDVDYILSARPAPIRPLLDRLDLTRVRGSGWGVAMRGPKRRLADSDARMIAEAMGVLEQFTDADH